MSLPKDDLQFVMDLYTACDKNAAFAARVLGVAPSTMRDKVTSAKRAKVKATKEGVEKALRSIAEVQAVQLLEREAEVADLKKELRRTKKDALTTENIKRELFEVASAPVKPPEWTLRVGKKNDDQLVPVCVWSDFHWGESVDPTQINGLNEFNTQIAKKRFRRLVERTQYLLTEHVAKPNYPGIVVPQLGDMVSGDIHDEITETNDLCMPEAVLDLAETEIWGLRQLADTFGQVFTPCIIGNHGRLQRKPRAKGAVHENWDWLLYRILEREFRNDDRVTVYVADSVDMQLRIYDTVYQLTHGNQFRGGGGIAGPYTPWMMGDLKKRRRQATVDQSYDILMMGHWHQLQYLPNMIVNGSLKGYDEYAFQGNFQYEPPKQALFLQHPTLGIIDRREIFLEIPGQRENQDWCSVRKL